MPTPDEIRAAVYDNVAEDILSAIGITDRSMWETKGERKYISARNLVAVLNGVRQYCGVSVMMRGDRFDVMAYSHTTTVDPVIRRNLTGAQLEDLFIELADI